MCIRKGRGCVVVDIPGIKMFAELIEGDVYRRPKYYVKDRVDRYEVIVELPGVDKGNIELYSSENAIYLRADVKAKLPWGPDYYELKVRFSERIKPDDVRAKYENGVLNIKAPKERRMSKIQVE